MVAVPRSVSPPKEVAVEVVEVEEEGGGMSELFEVPEEEDLSDLVDVSKETKISPGDVVGGGDADMSDDVLRATPGDIVGGGDADMSDDVLSLKRGDVVGGGDPDMSDDVLEPPSEEGGEGTRDEVSAIADVSEEDVLGRPEDNLDADEDISDLFDVSEEDVMGIPPKPRQPKPKFRRVIKRTPPTPTTLGRMR